jgi:hypothetical protein
MAKKKHPQLGELPPMYNFIMNPYPDHRLSSCPLCEQKSRQRKLPLLIHIDPRQLIALNYTCRYCPSCDLLMAHKHEIEHHLTETFQQYNPELVGNDYLIIGTVEKKAWKENLKEPKLPAEMLPHAHDFKTVYQELRMTRPGWYGPGVEPPIMEPPPSEEWVKTEVSGSSRQKVLARRKGRRIPTRS